MLVLLLGGIAGTVILEVLGTGMLVAGSDSMVLLTASLNKIIAAVVALQVNTATPPSGTGDGFWSRTSLATATTIAVIRTVQCWSHA